MNRNLLSSRRFVSGVVVITLFSSIGHAQTLSPEPLSVNVDSPYLLSGEDDNIVVAKSISGIACTTSSGETRKCLVADDEAWFAQPATLSRGGNGNWSLTPAPENNLLNFFIPLSEAKPLGVAPEWKSSTEGENCQDKPKHRKLSEKAEFDGEGVAYDGKYFYVVGSQGCGRGKNNNFKVSSTLVALVEVKPDGTLGKPLLSHRLAAVFQASPVLSKYFSRKLEPIAPEVLRGLNVEGVAVHGGYLLAGLRAPVLDNKALLVRVPVEKLFKNGDLEDAAEIISISIPDGSGIRDLAATSTGKLMILAGPEIGEGRDAKIGTIPIPDRSVSSINVAYRDLAPGPGKAEAILPLDDNGDTVMVLYDGAENGGPQVFRLSPPEPVRAEPAASPVAASLVALSPTAKKKARFSRQDRRSCRNMALRRLARFDPPTVSERRRIFRRSYRACLSKSR